MLELIANVNGAVNGVVWGIPMLILIIGTGVYLTVRTRFFQITHARHVGAKTIGGVFRKGSSVTSSKEKTSISQFCAPRSPQPSVSATSQVSLPPSPPEGPVQSSGCGSPPFSA